MRNALVLLVLCGTVSAQDKILARYGIEADLDKYPQGEPPKGDNQSKGDPKETLRSVLKAIDGKRVDYVLAHLAEPTFVDERVKQTGGRFEIMVKETTDKLNADPESLKQLRKLLTDGVWKEDGDGMAATCPDVPGKTVYFKRIGKRWFLENRIKPAKEKDSRP